jgi:hypothetical protein
MNTVGFACANIRKDPNRLRDNWRSIDDLYELARMYGTTPLSFDEMFHL